MATVDMSHVNFWLAPDFRPDTHHFLNLLRTVHESSLNIVATRIGNYWKRQFCIGFRETMETPTELHYVI
jgi:hypothetical protein